jgi:hypothetical protein
VFIWAKCFSHSANRAFLSIKMSRLLVIIGILLGFVHSMQTSLYLHAYRISLTVAMHGHSTSIHILCVHSKFRERHFS